MSSTGSSSETSSRPATPPTLSLGRPRIHRHEHGNAENAWIRYRDLLASHGYQLRRRYQPDWDPSWKDSTLGGVWKEDGQFSSNGNVMDATRVSDGSFVMIKMVDIDKHPHEVEIGEMFSKEPLASAVNNHCVAFQQIIRPPDDAQLALVVMPLLLGWHEVRFDTVGEVVDFISQVFEGLKFMHDHHVAHLDCTFMNIMMDATAMYPKPWHPLMPMIRRDWKGFASNRTRTQRPPRYILTDFGYSEMSDLPVRASAPAPPPLQTQRIPESTSTIATDPRSSPPATNNPLLTASPSEINRIIRELIRSAPPRSQNLIPKPPPSTPFPRDVRTVGKFLQEQFLKERLGFEFLETLLSEMTADEDWKRPTMEEVVTKFDTIRLGLNSWKLRSRVVKTKDNSKFLAFFRTISHWTRRAGYVIMRVPPIPNAR